MREIGSRQVSAATAVGNWNWCDTEIRRISKLPAMTKAMTVSLAAHIDPPASCLTAARTSGKNGGQSVIGVPSRENAAVSAIDFAPQK